MHVGRIDPRSTPVAIDFAVLQQILAWAAATPDEACGLLFGAEGRIARASTAENVAAEPWHRFEIDPRHLFAAHRRARQGPLALVGCWHSHPGGSPVPSVIDRAGVTDPRWLWLIAAKGGVRAFRPDEAGFQELALRPGGR